MTLFFMLIFTSGTSGRPKAVRITHEKVTFPGQYLAERFGLTADDVHYVAMPLFHSNAVMAGWAPALVTGAAVALREKFSASEFLPDVRRFGATYASYVGKPLTYVLATPERPDDADNTLRLVFGNEAGDRDIQRVRGAIRVPGGGRVRLDRERGHRQQDAGHAAGLARLAGRRRRRPRPGDRPGVPARGARRGRSGGQSRRVRRRAGEHHRCRPVRRLLQRRGGHGRADARRDVLVRRPRLPRRRRLGLLRRTHRRLAPRRRREPRLCADRAGPAPPSRDRPGGRLRRPRRACPATRSPRRWSCVATSTRTSSSASWTSSATCHRRRGRATSRSSRISPAPPTHKVLHRELTAAGITDITWTREERGTRYVST